MKGLLLLVLIAAALGGLAGSCSGPPNLAFLNESTDPEPTPAELDLASSETATTVSTTALLTSTVPTTTSTTVPTTTSPHPPGVLVIGDSILEGLNVLQYSLGPNTIYDTAVSRSAVQLRAVLAEHEVPQNLVVHLGTNGWWPNAGANFSDAFAGLSDRRIVLVNLSVDRAYTGLANTELQAVADEHSHVTLVDWNAAATPAILRTDGFHPSLEGYDVIGRMIAGALELPAEFELKPTSRIQ